MRKNTMKKFINILATAAIALGGVTSCTLDAINYVEKDTREFSHYLNGCFPGTCRYLSKPEPSLC